MHNKFPYFLPEIMQFVWNNAMFIFWIQQSHITNTLFPVDESSLESSSFNFSVPLSSCVCFLIDQVTTLSLARNIKAVRFTTDGHKVYQQVFLITSSTYRNIKVILAVMNTTEPVVKIRAWKKFRLVQDLNPWPLILHSHGFRLYLHN